jgi:putative ABC transport system substrate-binding protein
MWPTRRLEGTIVKKTLSIIAAGALAALSLAACGGSDGASSPSGSATNSDCKQVKIAVATTTTHASLDAAAEGFKDTLNRESRLCVTFDDENANGDQSTIASIAGKLANADYDLILGIATPMAQGLAQAVTSTPVLFTAVTDPVEAGLVKSWDAPGGNVTGTSDKNPVKEQLDLIKEIVPDVKTIGVIYNSGEANSQVQVEWVKDAAKNLGVEVKEATAATTADVQQAANSLDVDAIYVPTDNTVVSALDAVLQVGESKGIPVFPAEGDSVKNGGIATYGLSYSALGAQTADMAIKILVDGDDPATMPVETQSDLLLYLNLDAAKRMSVTIPQDLIDQADSANVYGEQ